MNSDFKRFETLLIPEKASLLIIDIQERILPVINNYKLVVENTLKLIKGFKVLGLPIYITEQYPKGLGATTSVIANEFEGVTPIEKLSFGCFGEARFSEAVEACGRRQLLVIGVEAHVCVMQTVLSARALGYEVFVVRDAVGSRDPANCAAALERMEANGAQIVTSEMAMFETLRVAGTPEFKRVLPLIK